MATPVLNNGIFLRDTAYNASSHVDSYHLVNMLKDAEPMDLGPVDLWAMAQKVEMVKALTEGDAKKLIEAGLADQKGWVEQTIDSIIDLAILCGIGLLLWNILPILYSRYLHKKTLKN